MITKLWSHLKIIFSVFCKGDIIKWRNEEEKIRNITDKAAVTLHYRSIITNVHCAEYLLKYNNPDSLCEAVKVIIAD